MHAPSGTSFLAACVVFLAGAVVTPLHAAKPIEQRDDIESLVASKRAQRAARAARVLATSRTRPEYVPGRPVTFPRELLPRLISEFDADIEEPGDEPVGRRRNFAMQSDRSARVVIGANRRINDPTGDPPASTQSENGFVARGRYMVAGWNESFDPGVPRSFSGYGYSSDGGKTWTDGGTLPHRLATDFTLGDPCLAADDEGHFYYASLYSADGTQLGVSVSRGRFRGRSFAFGPPVLAGIPGPADDLDKEWIAVDPDNGDVYVTYTRFFLSGTQQIELVRSRDGGRTWSRPVALTDSTLEAPQGSRPVIGPDHRVHVVYTTVDLADFTAHMRMRTSTNRGVRFGRAATIGEKRGELGGLFLNFVNGPPGFNRPMGVDLPSIAVDRDGKDGGDLYVCWPEAVNFFEDPLGAGDVLQELANNDSAQVATTFTLGAALIGSFTSATDQDWYSFHGLAGQTVEFFLTPPPGSTADGYLRLFGPGAQTADRLAFSYFGAGQAFIVFTLPADGTYFLRALPINPQAGIGDYLLLTGAHLRNPSDVARDSRDVVVSRSPDGVRWTRRKIVNHDAPRFDNAFPEVAVDSRGDVHVIWYDHRNDPLGILTDVYHTRSRDGGASFERDQRVNDGPGTNWSLVPSRLAPNLGDYIALVADGRKVYANWADGRLGSPDSWMAEIGPEPRRDEDDAEGEAIASSEIALVPDGRLALAASNPVRCGSPVVFAIELPEEGVAELEVFSVTGQRVRSLLQGASPAGTRTVTWDTRGRDGAVVAPGVYFALLRSGEHWLSRRVVLLP